MLKLFKKLIKSLLALMSVCTILAVSLSVSAAPNGLGYYQPSDPSGLNYRTGPGTNYAKLGAIAYNNKFEIVETKGEWGRFTTNNGQAAWACLAYANYIGAATVAVRENRFINATLGLNVRKSASTASAILTAIPYKTVVVVLEKTSNWGRVVYNRINGWICLDYTTIVSGNTVPTVPTAPSTPAAPINQVALKQQHIIAIADNLKKVLNANGGATYFTNSQITSATGLYNAMLKSQVQSYKNNVIIDLTTASVKATLKATEFAISPVSATQAVIGTIKDITIDEVKNRIVNTLNAMSIDDTINSLANNAINNINKQAIAFVSLHYKTGTSMSFEDAVNYLSLYQSIRMNSRTLRLGCDYFTAKLPAGFSASLQAVFKNTFTTILPSFCQSADLLINGTIKSFDQLMGLNIPMMNGYANDMKQLQKQLTEMLDFKVS